MSISIFNKNKSFFLYLELNSYSWLCKVTFPGRNLRIIFTENSIQKIRELLSGSIRRLTYKELYKYILDVDNKVRISQKLVIAKKKIRILLINQPQEQKSRALILGIFLFRLFFFLILDYFRLSATASPDQKQRSHTAEKEDTCYNYNKTGHWTNECPEISRYRIYEINELYPRIIEVNTNNKEIGEIL
jgi:hypothetical protein